MPSQERERPQWWQLCFPSEPARVRDGHQALDAHIGVDAVAGSRVSFNLCAQTANGIRIRDRFQFIISECLQLRTCWAGALVYQTIGDESLNRGMKSYECASEHW